MRKVYSLIFIILILCVSCNLDMLNSNTPLGDDTYIPPKEEVFSPLVKPSTPYATVGYYTDKINLTWEAVEGADYYSIERAKVAGSSATPSESDWVSIPESVYATSYEDTRNLEEGVYYAYRIYAHSDKVPAASEASEICYGIKLSKVQQLSATNGTSTTSINVSWEQMPGVKSYNIYASNDLDFSESELVGSRKQIQDSTKSNTNTFEYKVADFADKPAGSTVYFCIKSVGERDISDFSPVRSGYSLVIGAPQQPSILEITQGDSPDTITIAWAKDTTDIDNKNQYEVVRSSAGSSEQIIFSSADGDKAEDYNNGEGFFIQDTASLSQNTAYSYSIRATNDMGKSPATNVDGYILSSPYNLSLTPNEDNLNYMLSCSLPIGAEDVENSKWVYRITTVTEGGRTDTKEISLEQLKVYATTPVKLEPTPSEYNEEIRSITIETVNGEIVSAKNSDSSIAILGYPEAVTDFKASEFYNTGYEANVNGVYPIMLTWTVPSYNNIGSYVITRNDGVEFKPTAGKEPVYYDQSLTDVGKRYSYTIIAKDPFGRSDKSTEVSSLNEGYGAITAETFKYIFQCHLLKPWEYPSVHPEYVSGDKSSIWGYISQAGMGSLGSATVNGKRGGSVTYKAVQEGLGGKVSFTYTKGFSEADFDFYIAGNNEGYTMHVGLSGSGSVDSTIMTTGGMYKADVNFSSLSVSNNAFTGKYKFVMHYTNGDVSMECAP